jgi:vacuolar-type H+-ATPase subunit B/Vma2
MFNISGFFKKFKNLEMQDFSKRSAVIDVLKKHTGIDIKPQDIKFEQGIIRLSLSSLQKNEIFMKKPRILADIQAAIKPANVIDIL